MAEKTATTGIVPDHERVRLVLIVGALSAFGPLSLDMYLPGLPALAHDLDATAAQGQLTLTTCLLGLAGGQILAGPLSDTWGRRRPLLIGLLGYAVASLLCAFAPSVGSLVALRHQLQVKDSVAVVKSGMRAKARGRFRLSSPNPLASTAK